MLLIEDNKKVLKELWENSNTGDDSGFSKVYQVKPNYPVISSFTQDNFLYLKILVASPTTGYDQIVKCKLEFDNEGNCLATGLNGEYYRLYSEKNPQPEKPPILIPRYYSQPSEESRVALEEIWAEYKASGNMGQIISEIKSRCIVSDCDTYESNYDRSARYSSPEDVYVFGSGFWFRWKDSETDSASSFQEMSCYFLNDNRFQYCNHGTYDTGSAATSESFVDRSWSWEQQIDLNQGGYNSTRITVILCNSGYDTLETFILDTGGTYMYSCDGRSFYGYSGYEQAAVCFTVSGSYINYSTTNGNYPYVYGWYYN